EQDADIVIFLYRDDYYNESSEERGLADIKIGKQRNGPTGNARVKFFNEFGRFADLHRESK
ncbi:MAG TPA: replicative DNA helicase, partial [Fusobacteria bacterium]|nr:replicative DNA helicase [Fusobacteriota bacterium]